MSATEAGITHVVTVTAALAQTIQDHGHEHLALGTMHRKRVNMAPYSKDEMLKKQLSIALEA